MKFVTIFWCSESGVIKQEFETHQMAELAQKEWCKGFEDKKLSFFAFTFQIRT